MLQRLLVYRLTIFNLFGVVLLAYATYLGLVQQVNDGDSTHIVWVQAILFLIGLVSLFIRSSRLVRVVKDDSSRVMSPEAFIERGVHIHEISQWLVILGLVGTVVGLSMTMGGIDVKAIGTPSGAVDVISRLLDHMSIAFNTTIVGGVLGLWSEINYRMLKTATVVEFYGADL